MSCARPQMPSGGPVDRNAPELDSTQENTFIQTNFPQTPENYRFQLTFNEYVQIKNAAQEVFVSPPLSQLPMLSTRGRDVTIQLPNDTLKENTTYIISLGESIVDLNESNPIEPIKIVFSTGDKLDSLKLHVSVKSLDNQENLSGIKVLLYKDLRDSAIFNDDVSYAAMTNADGHAEFTHLRSGTYQVFALEDKNRPFMYDAPDELVGFYPTPIAITDSIEHEIEISVFKEQPQTFIKEMIKGNSGKHVILLNQSGHIPEVSYNSDELSHHYIDKDSLIFWQNVNWSGTETRVILDYQDDRIDTVMLKYNPISEKKETRFSTFTNDTTEINYIAEEGIIISFNQPIISIDPNKILTSDSTLAPSKIGEIKIDSSDSRLIHIKKTGKNNVTYTFLPGALTNIRNDVNDTLVYRFNKIDPKKLTKTNLLIKGLRSEMQYLVSLQSPNQEIFSEIINGVDSASYSIGHILPTEYELTIVEDENENGRYDAPSIKRRSYGENIVTRKVSGMKPNWDFEIVIDMDE